MLNIITALVLSSSATLMYLSLKSLCCQASITRKGSPLSLLQSVIFPYKGKLNPFPAGTESDYSLPPVEGQASLQLCAF